MEVATYLDESTPSQIQDNFERYKRDLSKYKHDEWTKAEEINRPLLPKLKAFTIDTAQVVNSIYKNSETLRTHGRAATEIFEQLSTIQEGELSFEEANELLAITVENAKRMAIFAWYHAKQQDEESREYALKALRLPQTLKHLETKPSRKKEAFSNEFIEQVNEAQYQQRIIQAATGGGSNYHQYGRGGRGSFSNSWNQYRGGKVIFFRGKNYFGGRGRGNPTYHHQGYQSHN